MNIDVKSTKKRERFEAPTTIIPFYNEYFKKRMLIYGNYLFTVIASL